MTTIETLSKFFPHWSPERLAAQARNELSSEVWSDVNCAIDCSLHPGTDPIVKHLSAVALAIDSLTLADVALLDALDEFTLEHFERMVSECECQPAMPDGRERLCAKCAADAHKNQIEF